MTEGARATSLSYNVGDRLVEITADGGPLSSDELEALSEMIRTQKNIVARRERQQKPSQVDAESTQVGGGVSPSETDV